MLRFVAVELFVLVGVAFAMKSVINISNLKKRCDALEEELRAAIASRDAVEEMLRAAWIRIQKLEHLVVSKQKTKIGLRKFAKRDHWKKAIDDAKEL